MRRSTGQQPTRNILGIGAMVLGVALFAWVDTILKLLVEYYPPLQVAGLRGLVALPILSVWIHWRGAWGSLFRIRVRLQATRGALAVGMLVLLTLGYRELPLANAYTLYFIAPLLITLLAWRVLGVVSPNPRNFPLQPANFLMRSARRPNASSTHSIVMGSARAARREFL